MQLSRSQSSPGAVHLRSRDHNDVPQFPGCDNSATGVDFRCPFHDCSTSGHKMATSRAKHATKEVFDLYRKYGDQDYIGEPVSQQEHMIQCAMLAEKEGYCDEVVLGVFLHDIGHLIGFDKSLPPMADVGTHAHEIIGEQFLKDLGFPDGVTSFVRGHVDAKRYLVCKYPQYHEQVKI